METGFAAGEGRWRARLGTLRQVVRQELVTRQLTAHLPGRAPLRVLDVGCGQGTQTLRLARRGHEVTGLDSSPALLADLGRALAGEPEEARRRVRTVQGDVRDLASLFEPGSFDVVLCHGVLMYFADPEPVLDDLARLPGPGGVVSLLVRNGDGLAMRPGLTGDWAAAWRAFEEPSYGNRIGVTARADRLDVLTASLAGRGLDVAAWYGVRVFTDTAPDEAEVPGEAELAALLACEERAGATDPYRRVAALTHVLAVRA
ncbi:class I SAM-dependent methyltransferase [Nonomuraea rhodomycinica]|uniref:Methyltransferase domain-containing protein n=1 Tax=Nonomuraea rhodomycinica TaxID=1712872 RepID=A0A7Y6IIU8_9ACTN|nr:methyltransferase domain-containing protein [Nonomuraea rhodomycinica]NUW39030.1 methyltransferase domain-containing protein [Nonomuraea rhodomycinica]